MKTEEEAKPMNRYLFATEYLSDRAVAIWQKECIKRCTDKPKWQAYDNYVNWTRKDNEIAIFTLYAYADFDIPKKFNLIFQLDKPDIFVNEEFELIQCIHEAWLPVNAIGDGHKHLCIFRFNNALPPILNLLHQSNEKSSTSPAGQIKLGFCNSKDFEEIKRRINYEKELKQIHGDKWWEHDLE